jgi:transposase-like protein
MSAMKKLRKITIQYSQAFKHQVVQEIEEGRSTISEVRQKYGIKGGATVQGWLRTMGKLHGLSKIVRVESPDEKSRIKELERQVHQLKEALADSQVEKHIAQSQFEIVCEQQGLKPEEVKKKLEQKRLSKR